MNPTLTDAELTLLGLLVEQPRHGYDLDKVIEERGIRRWTALGFSSIYYILDKLTARGLVEPVHTQRTGKSRTPYQATVVGRETCAAASLDAIESVADARARVLVGIANSTAIPGRDVAASLLRRAEAIEAVIVELATVRARQEPLPTTATAIFDYSTAQLHADATWARSTAATMSEDTMTKYDVKTAMRELYSGSRRDFVRVEAPPIQYLAIDGRGDPNTSADYAQAVEALYSVAYTLKFASKKTLGRDFVVGPLEGLWHADDMTTFDRRLKDEWRWTMMIAQPDWITTEMVSAAVASASAKKEIPAAPLIRLFTAHEGSCVQILHVGSYDDETPTLHRLHHHYLPDNGLTFNGHHHEIYLSDARRTPPQKLKTILRQPVRELGSAPVTG